MSKAISSKKPNLPLASSATPAKSCAKTAQRKKSPQSPLQDFNSMSSSCNSCHSSNTSIEAPKGCLKFFLTHSSFKIPVHKPKNISKTPNLAPNALPLKHSTYNSSKENLPKGSTGEHIKNFTSERAQKFKKNPACLYQWKSGKKSSSTIGQKSKHCSALNDHDSFLPRLSSPSEELKQKKDSLQGMVHNAGNCARLNSCHNDSNLTPLSKQASKSDLDSTIDGNMEENSNRSTSKTPPIQKSVSPEIQCEASFVSTTAPACYVVSGVTDKRKCRPRGILTVEENKSGFHKVPSDSFNDDDEKEITRVDNSVNAYFLPLPIEASMRWLLSPQNKAEKDLSGQSKSGPNKKQGPVDSTSLISSSSPSCSNESYLDISDSSDLSSAANGCQRKLNTLVSPTELPEFQGFLESMLSPSYLPVFFSPTSTPNCKGGSSGKGKNYQNNPVDEKTPSSLNSLGSENVIETSLSDSTSDLHVGLSRLYGGNPKEDSLNLDLNSVNEVLPSTSLLLNSSMPLVDSFNSSFQFDCLTLPPDSFDIIQLPKFLDDQNPWLSSSTVENASQSKMRISWREGLMSRLYELDEFDCCRCLSDEEEFANECSSNKLQIPHGPQVEVEVNGNEKLNDDTEMTETYNHKMGINGMGKEMFPTLISCSIAESISTDGGDLFDSDWTSCYRNKLFIV